MDKKLINKMCTNEIIEYIFGDATSCPLAEEWIKYLLMCRAPIRWDIRNLDEPCRSCIIYFNHNDDANVVVLEARKIQLGRNVGIITAVSHGNTYYTKHARLGPNELVWDRDNKRDAIYSFRELLPNKRQRR
jgi:hypothetical protein